MGIKQFIKEKLLPVEANQYARKIHMNLLLNNAFSRTAAAAAARHYDAGNTTLWEFSGFSQNGEDGIIDHLLTGIKAPNKYFVEIGAGNGLENNSSYLAHIKKFAGLQVEGDAHEHAAAQLIKPWLTESLNCFVDNSSIDMILEKCVFKEPDVFSIDIDGMDYYICKLLLEKGLRPKIIVTEYNSAFGPDKTLTIPYDAKFNMFQPGPAYLYYGVSLNGWQKLLNSYGYRFVTVESNGVNAFFIHTDSFTNGFATDLEYLAFRENIHQLRLFGTTWEGQFEMMKDCPFYDI